MVVMDERQKQRQQPSFWVAVARILTVVAIKQFDVVGDLALQKAHGIFAADLQQPQMREISQHIATGRCLQLGLCIAEVCDLATT